MIQRSAAASERDCVLTRRSELESHKARGAGAGTGAKTWALGGQLDLWSSSECMSMQPARRHRSPGSVSAPHVLSLAAADGLL